MNNMDKSYDAVTGRKVEIVNKAMGIDYSRFESGSIAFDYEALMNSTGYTLEDHIRIQREYNVGNTPIFELHNLTALARKYAKPGKGARIFMKDNVEDFAKGRVRLLEMKLSPRSPFAHKELKDITLPPSVLIALILRDHHMIIPHGMTGCCRWTTCISLEIRNPLQKFHPTAMPSTSAERRRPSSSAPAARGRPWLPCWRSRGFQ